ncbi:MAG TPA: class I SAM-dependent methyltransferase [Bryobacteraceae bacterium]|nr:class I SAM-dependent methyltransferase [Bryobacteraceae bacterium]
MTQAACSSAYLFPVLRSALARLPRDARVLDLGCGNGALTAALARPGWSVTAIDWSEEAIGAARAAWPDLRFVTADVTQPLDVPPAAFDAVLSVECIEHVADPRALLRNALRALAPGGILLLTTPYHGYLKNLALAAAGRLDRHWDPLWDGGHVKFFSRATLSRLLAEIGFDGVRFAGAGRVRWFWKSMVFAAGAPSGVLAPPAAGAPYGVECKS